MQRRSTAVSYLPTARHGPTASLACVVEIDLGNPRGRSTSTPAALLHQPRGGHGGPPSKIEVPEGVKREPSAPRQADSLESLTSATPETERKLNEEHGPAPTRSTTTANGLPTFRAASTDKKKKTAITGNIGPVMAKERHSGHGYGVPAGNSCIFTGVLFGLIASPTAMVEPRRRAFPRRVHPRAGFRAQNCPRPQRGPITPNPCHFSRATRVADSGC